MKYALDSTMAKFVDQYTIEQMKVTSLVLMERASYSVALKVAEVAVRFERKVRIAAVCGCGNNGADGIATARILTWQGLPVDIIIVGNEEHASKEFAEQKEIALRSEMSFCNLSEISEYDIIVDAIFGTGLSRNIEGVYENIVKAINENNNYVVSVDIPSGIDASTGRVLNCAVRADSTVTFGYHKTGMLLYPGRKFSGEVTVSDIGLCPRALSEINPARYFVPEDIGCIPDRKSYSNKGTYLRTLVIAGSEDMSGAAYLSGAAAYRCGTGLVEILSHSANCEVLKRLLPEAIISSYDNDNAIHKLRTSSDRADIIIIGPGLSLKPVACELVKYVLANTNKPLIIDADGLNIISNDIDILKNHIAPVIITPHIGEMMRLTRMGKEDILRNLPKTAMDFAKENNVICVVKDAATVVAEPYTERVYINTSGCGAMSKAGMGDVLTGVIAAMLALGLEPFSAAAMGVYVHGFAGEAAAYDVGEHSLLASDLLDKFGKILSP